MDKEKEFEVEFAKKMRNDMMWFRLQIFGGMILCCAAVVIGIHFIDKYMDEHNSKHSVYCNKQTYNGHNYLFLSTGNPGEKCVVHDPECACHKSVDRRHPSANPQKTEGKRYLIMPTVKETSKGVVSSISTR